VAERYAPHRLAEIAGLCKVTKPLKRPRAFETWRLLIRNSQLSNPPLLPVDRSKLFVMNRLANSKLVDAARIARAIEFTRFPPQELDHKDKEETVGEMPPPSLARWQAPFVSAMLHCKPSMRHSPIGSPALLSQNAKTCLTGRKQLQRSHGFGDTTAMLQRTKAMRQSA
jgi:hypothetical protein